MGQGGKAVSDTPNPNVFFRGDDMGIGNFPIKGGKISNQPINDGGYWFEKFKEANERIKRLEEAGDAMVETTTTPAAEAWHKAKEAKP
jgi:hypothetical protein